MDMDELNNTIYKTFIYSATILCVVGISYVVWTEHITK